MFLRNKFSWNFYRDVKKAKRKILEIKGILPSFKLILIVECEENMGKNWRKQKKKYFEETFFNIFDKIFLKWRELDFEKVLADFSFERVKLIFYNKKKLIQIIQIFLWLFFEIFQHCFYVFSSFSKLCAADYHKILNFIQIW